MVIIVNENTFTFNKGNHCQQEHCCKLPLGVPPGPRDPNPCLEVKKVPMLRDFTQKMDPCLGIF